MAGVRYCPTCLTTFREELGRCPNLGCGAERPDEGWGNLLEEGDLLDRRYTVLRVLAVGGAGITYLAREVDADGRELLPDLAIKVLFTARSGGSFVRRLATEAQILQDLDHDNIVSCLGFVRRAGSEPYLITRFEQGGSLGHHVHERGRLGARVAAGVLRQILLALDVAHQRGVVHRDLKPDNVLLAEPVGPGVVPHVRVADFGIAKVSGVPGRGLTRAGAFVGTPEYAAPEQFEDRPPTPATDVFAAGAVLFFVLTGRPPLAFSRRADLESTYLELLDGLPPVLVPADCPDLSVEERGLFQDIVDHTMVADAEARWTVHQVLGRLAGILGRSAFAGATTLEITTDGPPERRARPGERTPEPVGSARGLPSASPGGGEAGRREPPVPPTPPRAERSSTVGPIAAGLGMTGVMVVGAAGALAVSVALAAAGWWAGVGRAPLVRADALRVNVAHVVELRHATPLLGGPEHDRRHRADIQGQVQARGAELGRACGFSGPVVFDLLVGRTGRVERARVDDGYVDRPACVAEWLERLSVRNPAGRAVTVRAGLHVP